MVAPPEPRGPGALSSATASTNLLPSASSVAAIGATITCVPPATAAGLVLGCLLSAGQIDAADLAPGPEATSGASTSSRANYHANYHADYRANGTEDRAKGTEDDSTPRRDERRELPRDWRNAPSMDRYGRTGPGWLR